MRAALLLLAACWSAPIAPTCPPPVTRVTVVRCIEQAPPAPPTPTDDAALNDARELDYGKKLDRWVRLYVLPSCL
jgi:hypothetical protein